MKISDVEFKAFVEEVKDRNPIEDVIEETGSEFRLNRRGGHEIHGIEHDSLVITLAEGLYCWHSRGREGGDVFSWLIHRNPGWDFTTALEHLAKRAGMEMPRISTEFSQSLLEARKREDVWTAAQPVMAAWLRADPAAWAYVTNGPAYNGKPRYFTPETIERAGLGFTGGTPAHKAEMIAAFEQAGIDPFCPAAVAIVGYRGDVAAWAARWDITPQEHWLGQDGKDGFISGLLGAKRLVYPNLRSKRVIGFSARNILGSEIDREGKERKSYEIPKALAGSKQLYYNFAYTRQCQELVVVEGPGDAVALGQLGMPAVSLLGLAADGHDDELKYMRFYKDRRGDKYERTIYLGTDADGPGMAALIGKEENWPAAKTYGPLSRLVNWQADRDRSTFEIRKPGERAAEIKVKDANEYLAALAQASEIAQAVKARVESQETPTATPDGAVAEQTVFVSTAAVDASESPTQPDPAAAEDGEPEETNANGRLKRYVLDRARLLLLSMAAWCAKKEGADQHKARRLVGETLAALDLSTFRMYRAELAKAMKEKPGELEAFRNSILSEQKEKAKRDNAVGEATPIIGGWIQEHLVELLYDPDDDSTHFAVRYPDGRIEEVDQVVISGTRYVPVAPNAFMRSNTVLLPSEIGNPRSVLEMLVVVQGFIHRYLDVDPGFERLCAYYTLLSWSYDMFSVVPYLRAKGDFGTGKSRMIRTIGVVCYRPLLVGSATVSPIFRMLDTFRGTLILDEADFGKSDETAEIIKILNNGSEYGFPVSRSGAKGDGVYEPESYQVYGPKVIATRKKFGDEATESRCITREMGSGVPREDIPILLPWNFWEEAREVRNMLLGWRMRVWRPKVDVDLTQLNRNISSRLNQMTLALKTIMKDDAEALLDIDRLMEKLYRQQAVELSMTVEAKVLEAIAQIVSGPKSKMDAFGEPGWDFSIKNITALANKVLDKENEMEGEEEEEKKTRRPLTPKGVGRYLRERLNFSTERKADGYYLMWDEKRFEQLKRRYGVDVD